MSMSPGTLSDTNKSLSALYVHAPWYSVRHKQITVSTLCPCPQVLCHTNHCQHSMSMPLGTLSDTNKLLSALYFYAPRYPVRHKQITVSALCPCPPGTLSDTSKLTGIHRSILHNRSQIYYKQQQQIKCFNKHILMIYLISWACLYQFFVVVVFSRTVLWILKYTICVIVYWNVVNVQPCFNFSDEIIK